MTRDRLATLIGSFPLHTDDRGDDNQVLQDAFAGDYDARTEAVYQLADDILAELSAASATMKRQLREAEEAVASRDDDRMRLYTENERLTRMTYGR